jgi:hypothetical protein
VFRLAGQRRGSIPGSAPEVAEAVRAAPALRPWKGKTAMLRTVRRTLLLAGLISVVVSQWPDIRRYFKIKMLSVGDGHPDNVPAAGRTGYTH